MSKNSRRLQQQARLYMQEHGVGYQTAVNALRNNPELLYSEHIADINAVKDTVAQMGPLYQHLEKNVFVLKTGFKDIDEQLHLGGFQRGQTAAFVAPTAQGKTIFTTQALTKWAVNGHRCVLFAMEDTVQTVQAKIASQLLDKSAEQIAELAPDSSQWAMVKSVMDNIEVVALDECSMEIIEQTLQTLKADNKKPVDVVAIDSIMQFRQEKGRSIRTQTEQTVVKLFQLAKAENVFVWFTMPTRTQWKRLNDFVVEEITEQTLDYLQGKGVSQDTAKYFKLGTWHEPVYPYNNDTNRLNIPLYDADGNVISVARQSLVDCAPCPGCGVNITGKEIFRQTRDEESLACVVCGHDIRQLQYLEMNIPRYSYSNAQDSRQLLYNFSRSNQGQPLLVVESFADVWAAHQAGYHAVATMGSSLTVPQAQTIAGCETILVGNTKQNILNSIDTLTAQNPDIDIMVLELPVLDSINDIGMVHRCRDLDDVLAHFGTEKVKSVLSGVKIPAVQWQLQTIVRGVSDNGRRLYSPVQQKSLVSEIIGRSENLQAQVQDHAQLLADAWNMSLDQMLRWIESAESHPRFEQPAYQEYTLGDWAAYVDYVLEAKMPEREAGLSTEETYAYAGQYQVRFKKNRYGDLATSYLFFDKVSLRILPPLIINQASEIDWPRY